MKTRPQYGERLSAAISQIHPVEKSAECTARRDKGVHCTIFGSARESGVKMWLSVTRNGKFD